MTIFLSVGHKNRCQMLKRPFMVYHHSRNNRDSNVTKWIDMILIQQQFADYYHCSLCCNILPLIFHYLQRNHFQKITILFWVLVFSILPIQRKEHRFWINVHQNLMSFPTYLCVILTKVRAVSVYKNQSYKNQRWIFGKI